MFIYNENSSFHLNYLSYLGVRRELIENKNKMNFLLKMLGLILTAIVLCFAKSEPLANFSVIYQDISIHSYQLNFKNSDAYLSYHSTDLSSLGKICFTLNHNYFVTNCSNSFKDYYNNRWVRVQLIR